MPRLRNKTPLWYLFRFPVYLYRLHLGWLFGHRFLLLIHFGRRTGLRHQTVLEIVEFRADVPEAVVMSGFGPNSDWLRNIEARGGEQVVISSRQFAATHRFLGEEEAARAFEGYEHRNRFMAPILRRVLSWLVGWPYHGSDDDRHRLVRQLPLIAFRPTEGINDRL